MGATLLRSFRRVVRACTFSRLLVYVLAALACVIFLISFRQAVTFVGKPFPGFLVDDNLVVGTFGFPSWSGFVAGLKFPDRVVAIEGIPLGPPLAKSAPGFPHPAFERIFLSHYQADPEKPIKYGILRRGTILTFHLRPMIFSFLDFAAAYLIWVVPAILLIGTGLLVAYLTPQTHVPAPFVPMCLVWGILYLVMFENYSTHKLTMFHQLSHAFTPALILHFTLTFPQARPFLRRRPTSSVSLYIPSVLSASLLLSTYRRSVDTFVLVQSLTTAYLILAWALFAFLPWWQYLRRRITPEERERLRPVLYATAFVGICGALGAYIATFGYAIPANLWAPLTVFLPLAVGYALVKGSLFDVRFVLRRRSFLRYFRISLLAFSLLSIVVLTVAFQSAFSFGPLPLVILTILLTTLILVTLYRWIEAPLDRLFFRARVQYKPAIEEIGEALASHLDKQDIVKAIRETLTSRLALRSLAAAVWDPKQGCYELAGDPAARGPEGLLLAIPDSHPLITALKTFREKRTILDLHAGDPLPSASLPDIPQLRRFQFLVPLSFQNHLLGLLFLGEKEAREAFTSEDFDLILTVANQAALALHNAAMYAELEERRQEELRTSLVDKRLTLESFSAEIAHEMRYTVNFFKNLLLFKGEDEPIAEEERQLWQGEVARLERVLDTMAKFRSPALELRWVKPALLVEQAVRLLDGKIRERKVLVRCDLQDGAMLLCDPDQLKQVILNLLSNAIEASPEGGEIAITCATEDASLTPPGEGRRGGKGTDDDAANGWIVLKIQDQGVGIPPDQLPRIFNPWFTTKAEGTGLGLSICRRIIHQHRGAIEVESQVGKGTTFTVRLPRKT